MEKKHKIYIIVFIILVSICSYWFFFMKDYESRTMVVSGWNNIQLGFNIFPENEDENTLFLHGDDWRLDDFLSKQDYPMKMTFYYHVWNDGNWDSCVGASNWNHVYRIEDEYGNTIFESDLWQE